MDKIYCKNEHTVIWGDVLEQLNNIPDETVDLIFIDPPYNIGKMFSTLKDSWKSDKEYLNWCYSWIDMCIRKLK